MRSQRRASTKLPVPVAQVLRDEVDELAIERTWRRIAQREVRPKRPRRRLGTSAAVLLLFASSTVLASVWAQSPSGIELSRAVVRFTRFITSSSHKPARIVKQALPAESVERAASIEPPVPVTPPVPIVVVTPVEQTDRRDSPKHADLAMARTRTTPVSRIVASASASAVARPSPEAVPAAEAEAGSAATTGVAAASWRDLAARGDHVAAFRLLGSKGLIAEVERGRSAEDLFFLADLARLADQPQEALLPLEKIVQAHPRDPSAGLAAFTAGKIRMKLGDASVAAADFDAALRLGLPAALQDEARQRRSQARGASMAEDVR